MWGIWELFLNALNKLCCNVNTGPSNATPIASPQAPAAASAPLQAPIIPTRDSTGTPAERGRSRNRSRSKEKDRIAKIAQAEAEAAAAAQAQEELRSAEALLQAVERNGLDDDDAAKAEAEAEEAQRKVQRTSGEDANAMNVDQNPGVSK